MTQFIGEEPEGVWMGLTGKGSWESWSEERHPRDGRHWKGNSSCKQNLAGVDMAHEHNVLKASAQRISSIVARIVHKSKRRSDALFEYSILIPWLLPSTLIALGLMQTYDVPRAILGNKVLIGTLVLLLIAYTTVKLPFTFRMVKAAFFSIDENLEEAAKCMGSSTFNTMRRVVLPVIFPAIISVIVLNFNSLLADYDLTVFLYHPLFRPLGIMIKSASDEMASTDAQSMAFVYSVVLMVISSCALYFTQGDGSSRIRKMMLKRSKMQRAN